jgi:5'-nucleotidase
VEVNDGDSHKVVVNSFLSSGGDNFTTLGQGSGKADSGKIDLQSMVDYFTANPTASPDSAQRAIGVKLAAPASGTAYQPGEKVAVTLSSLLFSDTATQPTGVSLKIGDAVVGTGTIDPAIVDTTDEVGRASVTATIPTGLSGAQTLTVTVPGTDTSIPVPITVADATPPVKKVSSVTLGWANTILASHNSQLTYTVTVLAQKGVEATGTVVILDGSKQIGTVTLKAGDGGKAKVTLPKLKSGLHLLTAVYAGSDTVKPSSTLPFPVLLW